MKRNTLQQQDTPLFPFSARTQVLTIAHGGKPHGKAKEYHFNFQPAHLASLDAISKVYGKLFLALICLKDKQICAPTYKEFLTTKKARERAVRHSVDSFDLFATIPEGRSCRIYANDYKRGYFTGEKIIPRNRFPGCLFK